MPRHLNKTVNADNLLAVQAALRRKNLQSDMLDLRLTFNEEYQVMHQYLSTVYDPETDTSPVRVYPKSLPTQASGRWSVTNPPLNNFPPDIRDVIKPDEGRPWIVWDLDAIEAKIVAAYSHDRADLEAFDRGYDIHTITACSMARLPLPPDLVDPHRSEICQQWRESLNWQGKDDKRRLLAKVRYCLLYGKDASAVNGSKYERDMVKMGFKREDMALAATMFLRSKPGLVSTKRKWFDHCAKTGVSYTQIGRRRRLFGDWWSRAKEGWNHMVQGFVTDMTNMAILDVSKLSSLYRFIYQSHDGVKFSVPEEMLQGDNMTAIRNAVEREWIIEGEKIVSTATWSVYWADGRKEKL